ncbi:disease resistance protein RGA5-like [Panicum virgatum]|uniref:disease resistance protein RGA5-like n=1 Tax=Panicum virgatum TaxID=38727 RepID=UPI0019D68811|nr:disease resistance protein RGA5-like [Panicum virgatum]
MESMQAALDCVSKLPADRIDGIHKIWAKDLKELAYDIEDSVDAFMVRIDTPVGAKPHSFRRYFDRTIGLLTKAKHSHRIYDDIQEIKNRIQEVSGRRERYKFENVVVQPDNTTMDPRLPSLYIDVKKLVGTETPAKKLTALLMRGEGGQKQQLVVVSIVGVGGLGKTSLANLVYQRVRGQFQSQAFVSVSLKPEINKIFSSILRQVSGMEYPNDEAWDQTELIEKIRQILEKKRYIIVIDDIWSDSAWILIKCALIENNLGSKVIVTTRNVDVAKISCSPIDGTLYELDPLFDEDSKRLLYSRVYNEDEEIHTELEEGRREYNRRASHTACNSECVPSQVPRWFSSLSELSNVSIRVNLLRQRDLELLGALPALCFLKLQVDPYGTTDERCWLVFAQGVMPKLQRLELSFEVRKRDGGFDIGLENLLSLKHVAFKVDCTGARIREVQDAETKIRNAVCIHPSHPVLKLSRKRENLKRKE